VNAVFTVTLSAASGQTVTVNYATANGTAVAPGDYTAGSGTVTFTAGSTSQTITIPVVGDNIDEVNETFVVNLSGAANATIADNQATGTITDNDNAPTIAIGDVAVTETNTGTTNAVFTVTLSAASGQTVTVAYASASGTAVAPGDYTAVSGTLTFSAGVTSQTVTVPVVGDNTDEANETFVINLSGATNATIADTQATGTINDNDAAPSITVSNGSATEGNTSSTTANFTVTLSAASGQTVSVNLATANGTATDGADYTGGSGALTFTPGQTSITIPVTILPDVLDEADETLFINASSPVNATIADNQGIITIVDNDPTPTLSINSVSVTEPDSGSTNLVFTVTLSAAAGRTVTVNYGTANGSASQPSDYSARSGTLTFNAGVTTLTIVVPVNGDTTREGNETFTVNLSGASNATINVGTGTGTILNDD
jgi:large repetitive protein